MLREFQMEIVNIQDAQKYYTATKTALERTAKILEDHKIELSQETKRRNVLRSKKAYLEWKNYYLSTAIKYKEFLSRFHIWKTGALFLVPLVMGVASFIIFDILSGVRMVSASLAVLAIILSFLILLKLSKSSTDPELLQKYSETTQEISETSESLYSSQRLIKELKQKIANEIGQTAKQQERLRELERIGSLKNQCQRLFNENWRAMRSVEFEQYLERVFKLLGYNTQTTNTTGDQGVDLIVEKAGRRIAIQVKGYLNSVSNSAIQESFAGMRHYNCHACAVITNSRFTQSATELAASTNCFLIHEDNFKEFVFGELVID